MKHKKNTTKSNTSNPARNINGDKNRHPSCVTGYMFQVSRLRGFGLVEIVVVVGLLAIAGIAVISAYNLILINSLQGVHSVKALFLAEEGLEAARLLRDESWSTKIAPLTSGTKYWPVFSTTTGKWQLSGSEVFVDGTFERTLEVASVYRDANSDLADSGTLDPNAKKVTASVSWRRGQATTTKTITTYLTNLFE